MEALNFLEGLRTPFLTSLFLILTKLGEEYVFIIATVIVLWCVNKKCGFCILFAGVIGQLTNNFLKLTFKVERPWILDPNFNVVESAIGAAGGYSFPSGHTQIAVTTYGPIAYFYKKNKFISYSMLAIILLVSFSRLYLGVHYPSDVLFSLAFGLSLVLTTCYIFERSKSYHIQRTILFVASLIYTVYVFLTVPIFETDSFDFFAIEFSTKFFGGVLGFVLSWYFDEKYIRYTTKGKLAFQLFKIIVGVSGVILLRYILKVAFIKLGVHELIGDSVRYFIIVIFAGTIWPYVFNKIHQKMHAN